MELGELVSWLNGFLRISEFPEDSALNGLQVEASKEVNKVAVAVDAGIETFEKAAKSGADLLITHHGIYWGGVNYQITGINSRRVGFLLKNKLSLYACHLPLDAHEEVGNNVQILKALGFKEMERFGKIEWVGKEKGDIKRLASEVQEKIGPLRNSFFFGPEKFESLIVSSGASTHLTLSAAENSSLLIGEFSHYGYHISKEKHLNVLAAGHYATETFGVKALANKLSKKFGLETEFIDVPLSL